MGAVGRAFRAGLVTCAVMAIGAPLASAGTVYVNSPSDTVSAKDDCANVQATDYTPSGPSDTCTLPEAIDAVTAADSVSPGPNTISFISCGPYVITQQLPDIPGDTALNAYLVGGAGCNDADNPYSPNYGYAHLAGEGSDPSTAADFPGLIFTGSGSSLSAVYTSGFTDGLQLAGTGDDHIYYTSVGNDAFEQGPDIPENTGNGITVEPGSANDDIGYAPDDGDNPYQNDIYGNMGWGVYLSPGSGPTTVGHNFIGTDTSGHLFGAGDEGYYSSTGAAQPGNGPSDGNGLGGVYVGDSSGDLIGGDIDCTAPGDGTCSSNVIAGNGGPGVELGPGSGNATVAGNDIGLALNFYNNPVTVSPYCVAQNDDACPGPNRGPGVLDLGSGDVIGGTASGAGNQISGNSGPGVELEGSHATVADNLIGQDLAGSGATANAGAGILTSDAAGVSSGANRLTGNVVGGNTGAGIELDQSATTVVNNVIGTAGNRTSPLPNAVGVLVQRSTQQLGAPTAAPNTIAHNTGAGVEVLNQQGASADTTDVSMYRNSIFGNGALGIDLGGDGVTANQPLGAAAGIDGDQNFPVITSASAVDGQYEVHGTLDTSPNQYYGIYLYANAQCDPSGFGQGQTFVAGGELSADNNGHATFTLSGTGLSPGQVLSATADGPFTGGSEFGPCATVSSGTDVSVTQAISGGGKVVADEAADIDIHVVNRGVIEATGLTLIDTLPSDGTLISQPAGCPAASGDEFKCSIGDLAPGASEDLHILLQPGNVPTLTNSVEVDADQLQAQAGDNISDLGVAVSTNPNETNEPYPINSAKPTFGNYLRLQHISGKVKVTLPDGQRIRLYNFALVPVGTTVQTLRGVVKVVAALPDEKTTEYANFKYGRFKIAQSRTGKGDVNAVMTGSLAGCRVHQLTTKAGGTQGSPGPRPKGSRRRRLWGHDHGTFTITGNRGAATVRGTIWQVLDTCTTTVVRVFQDSVSVTGFGDTVPKHAVVKAGHFIVLHKAP